MADLWAGHFLTNILLPASYYQHPRGIALRLFPDGENLEGHLGLLIQHIYDLRRLVPNRAQGDYPVEELVIARLLQIIGGQLGQLAALTLLDQFQVFLVELPIKLGQQTIAGQTETVFVEGILNAAGEIATQATIQRSDDGLYDVDPLLADIGLS